MKIITPPQRIKDSRNEGKLKIFLAGSIEMGKAYNWQEDITVVMEKEVHHLLRDKLVIFNPRRSDWDSSWKQEATNPQFFQQVNWELRGLEESDLIFFYFCPGTTSPISLFELGLATRKDKVVVLCPEGFHRKGNVDIYCENFNFTTVDNYGQFIEYLHKEYDWMIDEEKE